MVEYFVALIPEKKLYDKISEAKLRIYTEFGHQMYLLDPPHMTLYLGETNNIGKVTDIVKKIASEVKSAKIKIVDWLLFENDKVTGKSAFAVKIDNVDELKKIQMKVISEVSKISKISKRYSSVKTFSDAERNNLSKYGFPFVGKIWIPHFSFCSANKDVFYRIVKEIKLKEFMGTYKINKIEVFRLENDKSVKEREFELKQY